MQQEFIPYAEALAMKELGYDGKEECLKWWAHENMLTNDTIFFTTDWSEWMCFAPLYQQAFRWFREKYDIYHNIYHVIEEEGIGYVFEAGYSNSKNIVFFASLSNIKDTYEEAQLACLQQLIKIVQNDNNKKLP